MKNLSINVCDLNAVGKIKKLNGGNLAPAIYNQNAGADIRAEFKELNIPITRLHDCPLENPACKLVDIPQIFANFHADAADARNYYFKQTDDYIKNCIELGTEVYYRLGVSIEHSIKKYFTAPPADIEHWVDICAHIIRHYTEGWADGFHFNILYWEIWNEPDCYDSYGNHLMWSGSLAEFNRFYVEVAGRLKRLFPHLKIGGPAHTWCGEQAEEFIKFCAEKKAVLDFYSYHCYCDRPDSYIVEAVKPLRELLDVNGFVKTEIHLNEWHYFPGDWTRLRNDKVYRTDMFNRIRGIEGGAFLSAVLTLWQDCPLDMAFYYTVTNTIWGLFDENIPVKSYYSMLWCGKFFKEYTERIAFKMPETEGIYVLCGKNPLNGKIAFLISGFACKKQIIEFEIFNQPVNLNIYTVNEDDDFKLMQDQKLTIDYPYFTALAIQK